MILEAHLKDLKVACEVCLEAKKGLLPSVLLPSLVSCGLMKEKLPIVHKFLHGVHRDLYRSILWPGLMCQFSSSSLKSFSD